MASQPKPSGSVESGSGRSTPSNFSEHAKQNPASPALPSINERLGMNNEKLSTVYSR